MLLEKFTLPKTDIRLITIDNTIYKIKLYLAKQPKRDETSYEEFCSNLKNQEEIEKIIIVSLTCKDDPHPIQTNNLTLYPYRKKWQIADKLQFYRNQTLLETCPYVYSFYIEPIRQAISNKNIAETSKQSKHHHKTMSHDGIPVKNNTKQASNHRQSKHPDKICVHQGGGIPVKQNAKQACHHSQSKHPCQTMDQYRNDGKAIKNNTKQTSNHSQSQDHYKTIVQCQPDGIPVKNDTKQALQHNQTKHRHKTMDQCPSDGIPVKNNTNDALRQTGQTNHLGRTSKDGAKTRSQVQLIPQAKAEAQVKTHSPKETRNTEQAKICTQSVDKLKPPNTVPLSSEEESDESENEDTQSISIMDGLQPCRASSPVTSLANEPSPEPILYISDSEDESVTVSSTKVDLAEKTKPQKPIKLIPASAILQARKRHCELLDEAEPTTKRRNYSVTEYLDANRHDVQEQDLQEQLRFQELATPADEKPAIEERRSSFHHVISSVKKLIFG